MVANVMRLRTSLIQITTEFFQISAKAQIEVSLC